MIYDFTSDTNWIKTYKYFSRSRQTAPMGLQKGFNNLPVTESHGLLSQRSYGANKEEAFILKHTRGRVCHLNSDSTRRCETKSLLEPLVEPGDDGFVPEDGVVGFEDPVVFVGEV